jgi:hypothetical protein
MKELLDEDYVPTALVAANPENQPAVSTLGSQSAERLGARETYLPLTARSQMPTQWAATVNSVTDSNAFFVASALPYDVAELKLITSGFVAALQHSCRVQAETTIELVEMTTNHARMHWELASQQIADIGAIARRSMVRNSFSARWFAFCLGR